MAAEQGKRLIAFALEQLAKRLESEGDEAYARSRRIRADHTDSETEELTIDSDESYELGYAEGRATALRSAAKNVEDASRAVRDD